jgi:hypothetical protein
MTLNLIRRLVKGTPLTAAEHDGNLDKLEDAIEDRAVADDLGTAAALDVGTGAGNVVRLDSSARLPAVNASLLTNLPASAPTAHKSSHAVGGTDALTPSDIGAATAAQGALAATAVQPGILATVATSGAYGDLSGRPALGTAAAASTGDFATAAQGVTNGNSHDHSGGDGAQIAYGSLSGLPSIPAPADAAPAALGATAAVGASTEYAREDHVHALPPVVSTTTAGLQPATGFGTITYAATVNLDLAALDGQVNTITLTGPLELTTSNLANGRSTGLRLIPGASSRTLIFPVDWVFVSAKPASIPANKVARLSIECHGTTNADVVAAIAIQP